MEELKTADYSRLEKLMKAAKSKNAGFICGTLDEEDDLLAAGFFLQNKHRIINLFPAANEEGKSLGASPFLIDDQIQRLAESNMIFDFEGSMIPGVARFYESFGAENRPYPTVRINNLPAAVKWLKN